MRPASATSSPAGRFAFQFATMSGRCAFMAQSWQRRLGVEPSRLALDRGQRALKRRAGDLQILGESCTRACRYCYVSSAKPEPVDPLEPLRLAQTAAQMGLEHVVVTSVDRDDLPDRGAAHYAATIRALRNKLPDATVEVLTPDFLGVEDAALETVLAARPDVFNHNIETVRRLHRRMRGAKGDYEGSLALLARAKELAGYPLLTKSGIIVGLGERNEEVIATMRDLRAAGVDVVTIGQYLQPSEHHLPVKRYVEPATFRRWEEAAHEMGFSHAAVGPMVRSSYHADLQAHAAGVTESAASPSDSRT